MLFAVRVIFLRSLIFALTVTAVSLAVDLLVSLGVQGGPPPGRTREFFVFRSALHGATFVLTAAGALAGFALMRRYRISVRRVTALGVVVGLLTLAALLTAMRLGGFRAMAAWLLVASIVVSSAGARLLGRRAQQP